MLQVGCQETSARVSVTRVGYTAAECSETAMAGTAGRQHHHDAAAPFSPASAKLTKHVAAGSNLGLLETTNRIVQRGKIPIQHQMHTFNFSLSSSTLTTSPSHQNPIKFSHILFHFVLSSTFYHDTLPFFLHLHLLPFLCWFSFGYAHVIDRNMHHLF